MTDEEVNEEYAGEGEESEEDEEGGPSEELLMLAELHSSIEQDIARLKTLQKKGKLQGEVLGAELVSTVMPLLLALAGATTDFAGSSEEWAESVDETLDALESGGAGAAAEPLVTQDDLKNFGWLFVRFQEFVQGMQQAGDLPEETRKGLVEIQTKLTAALEVVQRAVKQEDKDDSESEETTDSAGAAESSGDDSGGDS